MKKVGFKKKETCINFFEHYNEKYIKNRLIMNDSYDEEIYELLKLMLHKLHIYRISIHGLKKHKLLNQFQEDFMRILRNLLMHFRKHGLN